ncbi:MAG: hypothetical protein LBS10_06445 [Gracilibacteraceae bacterium]|nr:hypothetical protein [Gracilibacteraceae bacterium]
MFKKSKIFTVLLAVALSFAMVIAPAFAASNDPNLTTDEWWQDGQGEWHGTFNYNFAQGTAATEILWVVPANALYEPTSFSAYQHAQAVGYTILAGSVSGVTLGSKGGSAQSNWNDSTGFKGGIQVQVAANAPSGSAVVRATSPFTSATTDFTVVVTDATNPDPQAVTANISAQVYDHESGSAVLLAATTGRVQATAHDYVSGKSFLTVMDTIARLKAAGVITDYEIGIGDPYIAELTAGGVTEVNGSPSYDWGWQYRIYRADSATEYKLVSYSEFVGPDVFNVQNNDHVVWRFGEYDDTTLFPQYIPNPV